MTRSEVAPRQSELASGQKKATPLALITGASSGLGEALAYELAKQGWALVLLARRKDKLEYINNKCLSLGAASVFCYERDLAQMHTAKAWEIFHGQWSADVAASMPTAMLKAVVANAAQPWRGQGSGVNGLQDYENHWIVNFMAPALMLAFYRHWPITTGVGPRVLVAVTSSLGIARGLPGIGPYCAAKTALSTWVESIAAELAGQRGSEGGLSVLEFAPGYMNTEMLAKLPTLPGLLSSVEPLAQDLSKAILARVNGRDLQNTFLIRPRFYWILYCVLRILPRGLYFKLISFAKRLR